MLRGSADYLHGHSAGEPPHAASAADYNGGHSNTLRSLAVFFLFGEYKDRVGAGSSESGGRVSENQEGLDVGEDHVFEVASDAAEEHGVAGPAAESEGHAVEEAGERVLRVKFGGVETENRSVAERGSGEVGFGFGTPKRFLLLLLMLSEAVGEE